MSWAWNDPIDHTLDWSSVDVQSKFAGAAYERFLAWYGTAYFGGVHGDCPFEDGVSIGDDVQDCVRYYNMIVSCFAFVSPNNPQTRVVAGGFDTLYFQTPQQELGWTRGIDGGPRQWPERRKPREINGASAYDFDGNLLADGMVAFSYYNDGTLKRGMLYKRVSGAWVPAEHSDVPDVLSSVEASPNNCDDQEPIKGDYLGWWLFRDMRDLFNEAVWAVYPGAIMREVIDGVPGEWGENVPFFNIFDDSAGGGVVQDTEAYFSSINRPFFWHHAYKHYLWQGYNNPSSPFNIYYPVSVTMGGTSHTPSPDYDSDHWLASSFMTSPGGGIIMNVIEWDVASGFEFTYGTS